MADLSDVLNLLAGQIAGIVYPNGTGQPSIAGANVKIYAGWPMPSSLETDMRAGAAHISVYALNNARPRTHQLGRPYQVVSTGTPALTAKVSGNEISFGGTPSSPVNVYVLVNGAGYHYSVQSSDTLTTIATAVATQIPGATSSGAVVAVDSANTLVARVGGIGTAMRELRRQESDFQIVFWCPTPALRDQLISPVDVALSENTDIVFSDGSHGILRYSRTMVIDSQQKYQLYRRDLVYSVDYATTQTIDAPQIVAPGININDSSGNLIKSIQE
jgi:hypothetical protein